MFRFIRGFHRGHRLRVKLKQDVSEIKEGKEIAGFLVNKVAYIREFMITAIRLTHVRTGCDYLHLARDDSNNVFAVSFRTTPTDSSGLPHILKRTTLCGSIKYPCRDIYFKILNRSIASFMNAYTYADCTSYIFMTQNKVDYTNLMSVYLDAVFNPLLREIDFRHVGWRYEHDNVDDKDSPIIIKGIVYNEMKGALLDNLTILGHALQNNLFPSYTYYHKSGGDPMAIPNATHASLKSFHKKYYHPSNCRMYSYGNFPLGDALHFINSNFLGEYVDLENYSSLTKVPREPRWKLGRRKHIECRSDPYSNPKKASSLLISTLCSDVRSTHDTFVTMILTQLLVNGPNSAFYKSLVEPFSSGLNPMTGYDSHRRDTVFTVGLDNVDAAEFDHIVEIYYNTLEKVVNDGFDENIIKGILDSMELEAKHQTTDFGINMLYTLNPIWNHDGDVIKMIKLDERINKMKNTIADNPLYFQDLTLELLKDNKHRLILTMTPDEDFDEKLAGAEACMLKQNLSLFGRQQRNAIYTQGLDLRREQDVKQDLSFLPILTTSDVAQDVESVKLKSYIVEKVPVQFCTYPTNGLTYFRGIVNASKLSDQEKSLLPLFCSIVTKMGTNTYDFRQMDQQIKLKTGGITFSPHIAESMYDCSYEEGVLFRILCFDRNFSDACGILSEIFNSTNFTDEKYFQMLVKTTASSLSQGIADSGHLYAVKAAASFVSPAASRQEQLSGLSYVSTLAKLAKMNDLCEILPIMIKISESIMNKNIIRLSVNTVEERSGIYIIETLMKNIKGEFTKRLELTSHELLGESVSLHFEMPFSVSYCGYCINTVEYNHVDFAGLRVLTRLLTSKYLLPLIREKGGAYDAGADLSTSGVFSFYSYRDPNPNRSFDLFNSAKSWATNPGNFNDLDLEDAKLAVFKSVDAPIPPGSKGLRNFILGLNDVEHDRHRQALLRLKIDDIHRAADLLVRSAKQSLHGRVLIGPTNNDVITRPNENWQTRIVG